MNLKTQPTALSPLAGLRFVIALLLGASVLLSGCTTMRNVAVPAPGQPHETLAVKVGDKVDLRTKSSERYTFKVTAIESDSLVGIDPAVGHEVRVKFEDIASVQVKRVDPARTALAGAGGILIAAGVLALAYVMSGGISIGP